MARKNKTFTAKELRAFQEENHYKQERLMKRIEDLEHEYKELSQAYDNRLANEKALKKTIEKIARVVSERYLQSRADNIRIPLEDLEEMIIRDFYEQKEKAQERIILLEKRVKRLKETVASLQKQFEQVLLNEQEAQKHYKNIINQYEKQIKEKNDLIDNLPTLKREEGIKNEIEEEDEVSFDVMDEEDTDVVVEENKVTTFMVNGESIRKKIDSFEKIILDAVGTKGLSEHPEIEAYYLQIDDNPSKFKRTIEKLVNSGILESDMPKTALRKRGVNVYSLTRDIGKVLYTEIFEKQPVLSERERMIKEHTSLEHGYTIKEVSGLIKDMGYENISYDPNENRLRISGGKVWVPDIVATNAVNKKPEYFEVELGNHNKQFFFEKMDKALLKANVLHIVTSNKVEQEKVKKQYFDWKAKMMREGKRIRNFEVTIGTVANIMEKNFGLVFRDNKKE